MLKIIYPLYIFYKLVSFGQLDPGTVREPLGVLHPGVISGLPVPQNAPAVKTFTLVPLSCCMEKEIIFLSIIYSTILYTLVYKRLFHNYATIFSFMTFI